MTLVDFPGRVASTVFTRGCSFRCGFCHNPELVLPEKFNPLLDEDQFFRFLESRLGKIQGVCITGGEPTIQVDIQKFISHIKALGFDVKLDSNGSKPEVLASIIEDKDLDYIAMDVKSPFKNYKDVSGYPEDGIEKNIKKSIKLIMNSGIDYEFRTTVMKPYLEPKDFEEIGKSIKGAKRFYIQNFVASKQIDPKIDFKPFSDQELEESLKIVKKYVKESKTR